jgi:MFS transporter, PPP family, 3-phenylpropionic acid transporter
MTRAGSNSGAAVAPQRGAAPRRVEQAIYWRLCGLSAALFVPYGLHLPYFSVWLASLGLTDSEIATTLAVPPVLRLLLLPAISYVADRRGIAVTLAACACTMTASYFALGFAPAFALVFLGSVLVITAQGCMPPLADALALAEIRRLHHVGLRRIQYGRIRVGASLSTLVMMLLSGVIVSYFPGRRIIVALTVLAFVPALAAIGVAQRMRKVRFEHAAKTGLTEDRHALPLAIIVMLAAALVQSSHAEIYSFGTLQWKANGFTPPIIALAWATGVAGESLLFIFGGRYIRTIRRALLLQLLGAIGAVLRWIAMGFNPGAGLVLALQLMHALSFAATYMGSVLVLGWLAGPNHRARIQGWSSAAMGFTMAVSTLACGRLTQLYGSQAYFGMAALAAAGLGLAIAANFLRHPATA